jgi:hypothetical protein
MQRAATAADALARRATQCSFSSAFHVRDAETRAFAPLTERVYVFLIAPAVGLMGATALWRLWR